MSDVYPKFIVEGNNLIIAKVTYHKDLVTDKEQVKGGGWWRLKGDMMILHGTSFDFGTAKAEDIKACIDAGNVFSDQYMIQNIADQFGFAYQDVMGEIIKLK